MRHDERRHNCVCHKCKTAATGDYRVKFGRDVRKRFSTYDEAAHFLSGIRFKTSEGSFDARDYQHDNPMAFKKQVDRWLTIKDGDVSRSQYLSCERYILAAVEFIGKDKNVKTIGYGDIEDFLVARETKRRWSDKSRSNARSVIHDFFTWLEDRENIPVPKMPHVKFELEYRALIDLESRQKILDELDRIAPSKVAFGIDLLATYPALRPGDLLRVTEADLRGDVLVIQNPTKQKGKPKLVRLLEEHAATWNEFKLDIPVIGKSPLFFRHQKTMKGCRKDEPYGKRYFYKWWIKACDNLGIKGLDLYGGTRHSTATAIADLADPASAKMASGHQTNKAFERYCQAADKTAFKMAKLVKPSGPHPGHIIDIEKARN